MIKKEWMKHNMKVEKEWNKVLWNDENSSGEKREKINLDQQSVYSLLFRSRHTSSAGLRFELNQISQKKFETQKNIHKE